MIQPDQLFARHFPHCYFQVEACSPFVSNVFGSWYWNGFIYGPVLSTLVAFERQDMLDEACLKVGSFDQESYYSRSWKVLSFMTLNGSVAKAGELVRGDAVTTTTSSTSGSTSSSSVSHCILHSDLFLCLPY